MTTRDERLARARRSLEGLSVGDAFGEQLFGHDRVVEARIATRAAPPPVWAFTDDTVMALSVVDVLEAHGDIDRDHLATLFAARYALDPDRGYGGTAHGILQRIGHGEPWNVVSPRVFGGMGSMGNGGAMRAAPIGAWFTDDFARTALAARHSAEVTHAHEDGQAGAIAVAVAAAWVARGGDDAGDLFRAVLAHTPDGATKGGIARASTLPLTYDVRTAVAALGNGSRVIASDTVPFCVWNVARNLSRYEEALWTTASGLGDRDTTCAIVGGIVALHPRAEIPPGWIAAREPLDAMALDARSSDVVRHGSTRGVPR